MSTHNLYFEQKHEKYQNLFLLKNKIVGTRYNWFTEAVLTSTNNLYFDKKHEKYQNFFI